VLLVASATSFPFPSTGKGDSAPGSQAWVFIYSSCGRWVFPPLLWSFPPTTAFTSFPAPDYWVVLLLLPAAMFVYSSVGSGSSPLLWSFPPSATLTSFPVPGCWGCTQLPPEPLQPTWLVYLQSWEGFPSPNLQCSVRPTLFPACLCCSYCSLLSFSFFPGGGQSVQGAVLIWPRLVCGSTAVPLSSPYPCLPKPSGCRRLAARGLPGFSINMNWRCSMRAGGVEGSKFCVFMVVLPARCVSSVSPRFHYRRHGFCFLSVAAILEKPLPYFLYHPS
jgi:hypothetical protein